jgi:hypothetical protein
MELLIVIAVIWVGMIWLGGYVSDQKGRSKNEGQLLGLFFGLLGVIIAALLPTVDKRREMEQKALDEQVFRDFMVPVGKSKLY